MVPYSYLFSSNMNMNIVRILDLLSILTKSECESGLDLDIKPTNC